MTRSAFASIRAFALPLVLLALGPLAQPCLAENYESAEHRFTIAVPNDWSRSEHDGAVVAWTRKSADAEASAELWVTVRPAEATADLKPFEAALLASIQPWLDLSYSLATSTPLDKEALAGHNVENGIGVRLYEPESRDQLFIVSLFRGSSAYAVHLALPAELARDRELRRALPEIVSTFRALDEGDLGSPGADAPLTDPGTDAPPTDPGADAPPTDPGTDAPLTDPGADVPPTDPGADAPPTDPGTDAPPTDPGADAPPIDPGTDAPPTDPGADAPPIDPGADAPPTDPGADAPPTEPEAPALHWPDGAGLAAPEGLLLGREEDLLFSETFDAALEGWEWDCAEAIRRPPLNLLEGAVWFSAGTLRLFADPAGAPILTHDGLPAQVDVVLEVLGKPEATANGAGLDSVYVVLYDEPGRALAAARRTDSHGEATAGARVRNRGLDDERFVGVGPARTLLRLWSNGKSAAAFVSTDGERWVSLQPGQRPSPIRFLAPKLGLCMTGGTRAFSMGVSRLAAYRAKPLGAIPRVHALNSRTRVKGGRALTFTVLDEDGKGAIETVEARLLPPDGAGSVAASLDLTFRRDPETGALALEDPAAAIAAGVREARVEEKGGRVTLRLDLADGLLATNPVLVVRALDSTGLDTGWWEPVIGGATPR